MCTCICACMNVCVHAFMYSCMHARMKACVYACMYACIQLCMCVRTTLRLFERSRRLVSCIHLYHDYIMLHCIRRNTIVPLAIFFWNGRHCTFSKASGLLALFLLGLAQPGQSQAPTWCTRVPTNECSNFALRHSRTF